MTRKAEDKKMFSVRLSEALLKKLKHYTIDSGLSLQEAATRAIEEFLKRWTK